MSVQNLERIFRPQRVAVIGASDDPVKVGYTVLRNLITGGFHGVTYPINPKREAVQGIQAYANVQSLPQPPDLAVICTPAASVPGLIRDLGEAGTRGVVVTSAGFREMGEHGRWLEQEVHQAMAAFPGLRIIGPNCLGVIVPSLKLNASFAGMTPQPGNVAFVSQSGALCTAILDWAVAQEVGFSHFVSIGNMLDVGFADLIDYFGNDPHTEAIILYIESIRDPRTFMSAARAFAREKPIIAYKAGRFSQSAQAAASHTGALAGVDAVYAAAFERAGIVRVFDVEDMFDCAELLCRQRRPRGDRLAIITNAGGPGVMATDALLARDGVLAELSPETYRKLNEVLPPYWSHNNPIDVLGDAPPERYAQATTVTLADPAVDAVLVILTPQAMTDPVGTARALSEAARGAAQKPILTAWMGAGQVAGGVAILNAAGIPSYHTPEHAIRAFSHLVHYSRNLEVLYETPRDLSVTLNQDRHLIRNSFSRRIAQSVETSGTVLGEDLSKELLAAYGITVTLPVPAGNPDEAVQEAERIGYPVVLKILSPQITHKTDVGGVHLDLPNADAVRAAFEEITTSAQRKRPDADIQGVTVQKMASHARAFEMIVGAKSDPIFGPVLLVGSGGTAAEVFQDRALGLPPLNDRLALRMLRSLKSWPLLTGYRGSKPVDLDELLGVLLRVSYLVSDFPEIVELDINPLLISADGAIALDARMVVDQESVQRAAEPYSHLAIQPYPEEYIREGLRLRDGTSVTLRPIRPEDQPRWQELLAACSPESIRYRFRYLFSQTSDAMARRYCFIDYAREIAIVAEVTVEQENRIVAVGRLLAESDHHQGEYALLVADRWQGRGLGGLITEHCLEIARQWGLERVFGETTPDNARMLAVFRRHGFQLEERPEDEVVFASRQVGEAPTSSTLPNNS